MAVNAIKTYAFVVFCHLAPPSTSLVLNLLGCLSLTQFCGDLGPRGLQEKEEWSQSTLRRILVMWSSLSLLAFHRGFDSRGRGGAARLKERIVAAEGI